MSNHFNSILANILRFSLKTKSCQEPNYQESPKHARTLLSEFLGKSESFIDRLGIDFTREVVQVINATLAEDLQPRITNPRFTYPVELNIKYRSTLDILSIFSSEEFIECRSIQDITQVDNAILEGNPITFFWKDKGLVWYLSSITSTLPLNNPQLLTSLQAENARKQFDRAVNEAQCLITKVLNIPYDTITKVQIDYTQEILDIVNLTLSEPNIMYANPTRATYPVSIVIKSAETLLRLRPLTYPTLLNSDPALWASVSNHIHKGLPIMFSW